MYMYQVLEFETTPGLSMTSMDEANRVIKESDDAWEVHGAIQRAIGWMDDESKFTINYRNGNYMFTMRMRGVSLTRRRLANLIYDVTVEQIEQWMDEAFSDEERDNVLLLIEAYLYTNVPNYC